MKILFLSEIQWLSQRSRKHQIVRRFPADWEILFVSPINLTRDENSLRVRRARDLPNLRHVSILLPKPDSPLPFARPMSGPLWEIGRRRIESLARDFGPDVVVCSNIWTAPLVPWFQSRGVPVVYDCNDFHPRFYPGLRARAEGAFEALVSAVDEVVASSAYLRKICGRGVVIGNGADLETFDPDVVHAHPAAIARGILADREDLVLYLGSIDDRLDFPILEHLSDVLSVRAPRSGLVLVGRIFDRARRRADRLRARHPEAVQFTGRVPYAELPAYLSCARVGVAPFVLTEKTAAINANKLYMYAAMGRNIVSTPFSDDVRRHDGLAYLASEPEAFARATLAALEDETRRTRLRDAIAAPNSWSDRASDFARLLAGTLARSSG